jgi:hypothetical protein
MTPSVPTRIRAVRRRPHSRERSELTRPRAVMPSLALTRTDVSSSASLTPWLAGLHIEALRLRH